jgi:hypothetical protein
LVQPTLPTALVHESLSNSVAILDQMMVHPRISEHPTLRVRRVYADVETSRDSALYKVPKTATAVWPVYGGDSFDIWEPDTGQYYATAERDAAFRRVQEKRSRSPASSPYGGMPRRWRDDPMTHPSLAPRIAFRNITNRTNRRTLLAALIPGQRLTVETAPWVLWQDLKHPSTQEAYLLGMMCSIPADWWMRRFVEGHVDEEAFNCLPVPDATTTSLGKRIIVLAGRLACPDKRFAAWAKAVGVKHGKLGQDEKDDMIHELDAVVAHLYGLSEAQLVHIFETFHEGWDYVSRLDAVRRHYRAWAAKS